MSSIVIYFIADYIPFMSKMPSTHKIAVAVLFGTIFVVCLPADILVLLIKRKGQLLVSHGYTRMRLGDTITLVGLEKLKFNT